MSSNNASGNLNDIKIILTNRQQTHNFALEEQVNTCLEYNRRADLLWLFVDLRLSVWLWYYRLFFKFKHGIWDQEQRLEHSKYLLSHLITLYNFVICFIVDNDTRHAIKFNSNIEWSHSITISKNTIFDNIEVGCL